MGHNAKGEYVVMLNLVAVSNVYPITRTTDYDCPENLHPKAVSNVHYMTPVDKQWCL